MSVYSVAQINSYIQRMLCEDFLLQKLTVRGEVSGCKYHTSGHVYFTLKDESGVLSCMMFAGNAAKLAKKFRDGDQVLVTGQIRVYEKAGKYQLYAETVKQDGQGALFERYEALKKRLEESGMFDASYKRPIPKYIRTLGVVTAPTGAAVRDIINIAHRRNPGVEIILYPAIVQGDHAADSIVRGIQTLTAHGVDCMIVGRGGGSIEDLWAFNEEAVADAIFACPIPVISAVGHETDFTIADFVADLRAPTPSAAAELAVFELARFEEDLADLEVLLSERMNDRIAGLREALIHRRQALRMGSPAGKIREKRMRLTGYSDRLRHRMETRVGTAKQELAQNGPEYLQAMMERLLKRDRSHLETAIARMSGISPLNRLKSGYAYVTDEDGHNVHSVNGISPGVSLMIRVEDGSIRTSVTGTDRA